MKKWYSVKEHNGRRMLARSLALLICAVLLADIAAASVLPSAQAANTTTCNCVVWRLDDIQDNFVDSAQVGLIDHFITNHQKLSAVAIMNAVGNDTTIVNEVKKGLSSGILEIGSHAWNHVDYAQLDATTQQTTLQQSKQKITQLWGVTPSTFVPPFNSYNDNTLAALQSLGFKVISSEFDLELASVYDPSNPNASTNQVYRAIPNSTITDSHGLYHLPQGIGFYTYGNSDAAIGATGSTVKTPVANIESAIDSNIANYGYAVVTLHPDEFAVNFENGAPQDQVSASAMSDLDTLFAYVNSKGYTSKTFSEVVGLSSGSPSPTPTPTPTPTPSDTTPPSVPQLASPTDNFKIITGLGGSAIPTFSWTKANDTSPVTYDLIVASSADFANSTIKITKTGLGALTYTPAASTESLPAGTYFWEVRASDSSGNKSPFSSAHSFTVTGLSLTAKASPAGGTFTSPQTVSLVASSSPPSNTTGLTVYYTVDGSDPSTKTGVEYQGPITVTTTSTLKFVAKNVDGIASPIATERYVINRSGSGTVFTTGGGSSGGGGGSSGGTVFTTGGGSSGGGGGAGGGGGGSSGGSVSVGGELFTYPDSHFVQHPLDKVIFTKYGAVDAIHNIGLGTVNPGQQVSISATFKNFQNNPQNYVYISEIEKDGLTFHIDWQPGQVNAGQTDTVSRSWIAPQEPGNYVIKVFVWDKLNQSPMPLSEVGMSTISVVVPSPSPAAGF
jgi:peptidoglycan/xylan/chitin deacetylase (PgdA/CDA1 family)